MNYLRNPGIQKDHLIYSEWLVSRDYRDAISILNVKNSVFIISVIMSDKTIKHRWQKPGAFKSGSTCKHFSNLSFSETLKPQLWWCFTFSTEHVIFGAFFELVGWWCPTNRWVYRWDNTSEPSTKPRWSWENVPVTTSHWESTQTECPDWRVEESMVHHCKSCYNMLQYGWVIIKYIYCWPKPLIIDYNV